MSNLITRRNLLYADVVQKLTEMINTGNIKPGEKFPSERELIKSFGISRNVLREAFHILEERGIIRSILGSGRFLRGLADLEDRQEIEDGVILLKLQKYSLLELYQVRLILEEGVINILARRATQEDTRALEDHLNALLAKWQENDNTMGEFTMHLAYAERCGNSYLYTLLKETTTRVMDIIWEGFTGLGGDLSENKIETFYNDHIVIIRALEKRDACKAVMLINKHLSGTIKEIEKASPQIHRQSF